MTALLVALGGALGSALRYALGQRYDDRWHHGTLAANTVASLLLGACAGWALHGSALALIGTGFCGGLSTYSSLMVQSRDLGPARGAAYLVGTIALGLGAATLGFTLAG
ncbi:CrcB protein [Nocardioides aromaticivorans]|uniref:Fluoride-specific ion channel FluC n=1 Tax=Nocardioides aromaticivorans TaxID=200618 RepID=A0A7Y9ZFZ4_9ACTN|nr:CrcB family protein [Nocardioides aromaticivorans]NYI44135.1 CrcB protein [Nocardioides aromaticivorans]